MAESEVLEMAQTYTPARDYCSRYLGNSTSPDTSVRNSAEIHFGILRDMKIKLTQAEIEHLFSLPSEIAIENWCRSIMMKRL